MIRRVPLSCLAIALAVAPASVRAEAQPGASPTPVRVESFSPQGVVKDARQVRARFSRPIVAFGDPLPPGPFERDCADPGAGRWLDERTWAFDFARDIPGGVRCTFSLRAGLRALDGTEVVGPRRFTFSTGGPAVRFAVPGAGAKIAEDQAFLLKLDGPVEPASVERHAAFRVSGLADPVGVRVVTGPERDALVASFFGRRDEPDVLVLAARQRFAAAAKVTLDWGRGVRSPSGVGTQTPQRFAFEVRPPFSAALRCERENPKTDCIPLAPIRLALGAPVSFDRVSGVTLRESAPGSGRAWPAEREFRDDGDALVDALVFRGPFPERAALRVELPPDLVDDAGRPLAGPATLETRTAPYPPLAKFSARFGILEAKAGGVLPVTLRSVEAELPVRARRALAGRIDGRHAALSASDAEAVLAWLRALDRADRERSVFATPGLPAAPAPLALPALDGAKPLQVVGIPLPAPGLHVVEIESAILGRSLLDAPRPLYVATGALVTDLAVHFKWGDESSLVFVTGLHSGLPVEGARVRVFDCAGTALSEATTDRDGVARLSGLPPRERARECTDRGYGTYDRGLLVTGEAGGDASFVHTSWHEGIEPWRFGLPTEWRPRAFAAHTVLDRALLRAGDTVHMKHVLRRPVQEGFAQVAPDERPATLRITHIGTFERFEQRLVFADDGSAVSEWAIPTGAKLGAYEVSLVAGSGSDERSVVSGTFRVEEFRVPLLAATIQPPAEALVAPREVPVELAVRYLGGGPAGGLPVTLRSQVRPRRAPVRFDDFEAYAFGRGAVREGTRVRGGAFGEAEGEDEGAPGAEPRAGAGSEGPVESQALVLDGAGTARAVIAGAGPLETPMEAQVELELRDPSGEVQTASRTVPLWPAEELVGIDTSGRSFVRADEPLAVRTAVVDLRGRPVWRARVAVDAYERRTYATRKRLVGGFYAYEQVEDVRRLGPVCAGRTDRHGRFACEAKPPAPGDLVLVARVGDGAAGATQRDVFVAGRRDGWFAASDADRMDLVPDAARYEPGDTARIQVRMPFRDATALVTVEREGVSDVQVVRLSASDPVVKVPVRDAHAPNAFVSVLALRGRVAEPQPTGLVDLAKPAYRLGVIELRVGRRANELRVRVEPEREVYRVRERAKIGIAVETADGDPPPPGSEVAVAAVDEGLLELLPNASLELLDAMLGRRSWGVSTATAQMHVVGRRHFGQKALPAGGGGGRAATRELFDTLLSWQARVPLDAKGRAAVEIPLNDSLTGFRIAAVATGGTSLFGTGSASIRTTQDLMVLPGLPPIVRDGDRFRAELTLRNTTRWSREVALSAQVGGLGTPLPEQRVSLAGGESREVGWDVTVPPGAGTLAWQVDVTSGGEAADRLAVSQRVLPAVPERVVQATLAQLAPALRAPVERPAGAQVGRGGVEVGLRARLADGLPGVERWMRAYPYDCLEQRLSVAVALGDTRRWQDVMDELPAYLDADGLAKFFPQATQGSDVLTSYLVSIADSARLPLPAGPRERMAGGLERFVAGQLARASTVGAVDLPLRKLAAIAALARLGRGRPDALAEIPWQPALWPTSGVLDADDALRRLPGAPRRAERLRETDRVLRARAELSGTTLVFSTEPRDGLDWLLATPDANAARLVLLRVADPAWRADVPRLVRGALGRQAHGRWSTTTANAWGAIALRAFSGAFEAAPVEGETRATLAGVEQALAWTAGATEGTLRFPWPAGLAELGVRHAGAGRPWAVVQSVAALALEAPLASGFTIAKTLVPVVQRTPGAWSRGDVVRVRLALEAQSDRAWVVVDDPIPAGATILGSGLGGDSRLATQGEESGGCACEAFTERSRSSFRRTYAFAPKGSWSLEYTVRLHQSGTFHLPPTRVEAMYAPDVFGELPNAPFEVRP